MAKLLFLHGTRNDFRKFLLIFLIAWSGTYPVWAQKNVEIQGKVIDKRTGDPVIGASLSNKDDNVGTVTDIDGNFKVRVSSLPATLVVNFIGYKTEEIDVYEQSEPLTLALTEDRNLLNTLVVVGYQQTTSATFGSAIWLIRRRLP